MADQIPHQVIALFGASAAVAAVLALQWQRRRRHRSLPAAFSLNSVVRPNILRVEQYAFPPRYEYDNPILLDANENPHGPALDKAYSSLALERYPDPRYSKLRQALGKIRQIGPEHVFLGNGSDEVIDMLIRTFCVPAKDSIIVCPPTYSMYSVFAAFNDASVVNVPLTAEFALRPHSVIEAMTQETKVIFLCSPGNPTGRLLSQTDIESVLKAATGAVVVVDEAYIDFAEADGPASLVPWVASDRYPNLIVMQTLSKAWGLAGARMGIAFASAEIIKLLNKTRSPFNISSLTESVTLQALDRPEVVERQVQEILAERKRVAAALTTLSAKVRKVPFSDSNFLLFQVDDAKQVAESIASESSVVVRYRGSMLHCHDCIRVTIGTKHENDLFLAALRKAIE